MTSLVPPRRPRPMYHLLVFSDKQAWNGSPITFERRPRDRVPRDLRERRCACRGWWHDGLENRWRSGRHGGDVAVTN